MTFIEMIRDVAIPVVKAESGWAPTSVQKNPNELVKGIINTLLTFVVIAAVIYIMFAGFQYISASGDANKAKAAMSSITNAIIGLIVAFAAYILVNLVMGQVFKNSITGIPT